MEGTKGDASIEAPQIVSQLPPPPYFYKFYGDSSEYEPLEPPKPIKGTYLMFGKAYSTEDVLPSLEEEGRTQLYPTEGANPIAELNKLNTSLLIKFLELVDYLINEPSEYKSKVEDIELIMVNMYHLLNTYRPHQARQTLVAMMEEQLNQRNNFIAGIESRNIEVNTLLENALKNLQEGAKRNTKEGLPFLRHTESEKMELEENQRKETEIDELLQMKNILDQIPRT